MTVVAADFNGDGKIDLAGFDNNGVLTILTNNGNGAFSVCFTNRFFFSIQSITAADVNHDDKVDIIMANRYENTITILTNNSAGSCMSRLCLKFFYKLLNCPVVICQACACRWRAT